MSRTETIAAIETYFDSGGFAADLARRVAIPTESQNPERSLALTYYVKDELQPMLEKLGFKCTILPNPAGKGGPFLVAERMEDSALPTVLTYGHGDVIRGQDEQWRKGLSPWALTSEGDRLYGRGTADNKGQHTINLAAMRAEQRAAEAAKLEQIKKQMEAKLADSPKFGAIKNQIKMDMTPDGLRIQIVDDQNRPMFDSGSPVVKPYMRELLREIGAVLAELPNRLTLEGHTDAQAFSGDRDGLGYGNWELSSDRANASRRELIAGGLPAEAILRVQGLASSVPFLPEEPLSPSNRRISIIVMNRDAEDRFFQKTPDDAAAPTEAAASSVQLAETPTVPSISNPNAR
jgi:flagellar motor protein MotB